MPDDIVASVIAMASERMPITEAQQLVDLEREARLRHAGERRRIAEHPRPQISLAEIDERLRARKSVREVATELGVSRRTIYRLLRRRHVVPPRPTVSHPA